LVALLALPIVGYALAGKVYVVAALVAGLAGLVLLGA
jgi:hypothetical protein